MTKPVSLDNRTRNLTANNPSEQVQNPDSPFVLETADSSQFKFLC